jgi:hypothetical protein
VFDWMLWVPTCAPCELRSTRLRIASARWTNSDVELAEVQTQLDVFQAASSHSELANGRVAPARVGATGHTGGVVAALGCFEEGICLARADSGGENESGHHRQRATHAAARRRATRLYLFVASMTIPAAENMAFTSWRSARGHDLDRRQ